MQANVPEIGDIKVSWKFYSVAEVSILAQ